MQFKKLFSLVLMVILSLSSKAQADLIINPTIAAPTSGCELGNSLTITVVIVNIGSAAVFPGTNIDVTYSLNGGPTVNETINLGTFLNPSGSYIYSFVTQADFSACQIHTLDFTVNSVADGNAANNNTSTTVTSDCPPTPGWIAAPDTVCQGINSGNLVLTGYNGNVENWVQSTDGGATWNWIANTSDTQPYTNISTQEVWWVLIGSPYGYCADDSSDQITIEIVPQTNPGTLPTDFDICDNGNAGVIDLTGYLGDIIDWEYSDDNGATWNSLGNTSSSYSYLDLTDTMMYQVLVQNNICPAVYSAPITLTLVPGSDAGAIIGENLVCNFENDSSLEVNPVYGTVVDWVIYTDSNPVWTSTGVSDTIYDYNGLLDYTIFGAIVQVGACPYDTAFHSIIVLPLATDAGPTTSIFEGDSIQLYATGGSQYLWSPIDFMDDPTLTNPTVWPDVTTTYSVQITDINGCTDTASLIITVLPNITDIVVPNLITPNGDGFNEVFFIPNIDTYPENELVIFNSYGQVIYQASPYDNSWDATFGGSVVPDGTYYYILDLKVPDFVPDPLQGTLTIMGNE